jgi:LuxR family transcriptional regulator, maltose regulon positive regulatory protein
MGTALGMARPASSARGTLIPRRALFDVLDDALAGQVTVVSGAPGSGKTMLLQSWVEERELRDRVAWVSIERDERDPQRFWAAVVDELRRATGEHTPVHEFEPRPDFDGGALIEFLLGGLAALDERVVLVIDDLHEVRSREVLSQLELLLTRLPPALHVILVTRRDPRLRLSRLRLAGDVTEIRQAELRFSLDEARDLLARAGVSLSEPSLALLHERTEGWAAGLRLAALSLARHPDPERFVREFSGSERTVADYLLTEMLEREPADARDLLLRTSVLERVCGPLADLLTGGPGSERILQALERENAFVVALDAGRSWFRYHHLLADLLRLELRRTDPDSVPRLHRAAAQWFAEHGEVVEAVRHVQAAGDWQEAARLLAQDVISTVLGGQRATVRALLAEFPPEAVSTNAELAAVYALDELMHGSLDAAQAYVDLAEQKAAALPDDRRRRLERILVSGRLALARGRGDLAAVLERAAAVPPLPPRSSRDVALCGDLQPIDLMNLGIAEMWAARFDDAEQHLERGVELARRAGRPYLEMACRANLARAAYFHSFPLARQHCVGALAIADARGWSSDPLLAIAQACLGEIEIWAGRLDEGEHWLHRAAQALPPDAQPVTALALHMATGLLHAGRGRHAQALREFRAADEPEAVLMRPPILTPRLHALLLQTHARLGNIASARAAFAEMADHDLPWGDARAGLAAIELADGNAEAAIDALAPVLDGSVPTAHASSCIQALVLDALARDLLGDAGAATRSIERALDLAEPDRIVLPFVLVDTKALLERHRRQRSGHAALLMDVLDLVGGASPPASGDLVPLFEPLSESELRVLRYLPSNLSGPEIASELYVSPSTVKTHMRHIYGKLGVHSRTSAVERARGLGLLARSARGR